MKQVYTKIGMPMEEFIRLYDTEGPFELINGERIPVMPTVAGHNRAIKRIFLALDHYGVAHKLGEAFTEAPFVLTDEPQWVEGSRVPDVMFFSAERLAAYVAATRDWELKPYVLVPDLVIEIMSPSDDPDELDEKVDLYLADGVLMAWVMNPRRIKVSVYTPAPDKPRAKEHVNLFSGDLLTGGDIVPGFEMPVATIFE